MRLPHSLPRIRLIATACTALALTLLPSQGQSQGVMNLLNALGGGGSTTSNTGQNNAFKKPKLAFGRRTDIGSLATIRLAPRGTGLRPGAGC